MRTCWHDSWTMSPSATRSDSLVLQTYTDVVLLSHTVTYFNAYPIPLLVWTALGYSSTDLIWSGNECLWHSLWEYYGFTKLLQQGSNGFCIRLSTTRPYWEFEERLMLRSKMVRESSIRTGIRTDILFNSRKFISVQSTWITPLQKGQFVSTLSRCPLTPIYIPTPAFKIIWC